MIYVKGFLLLLQAVLSVVFILLIMTQSSKNEGFGTIGVQAPTNFKGKPGFEERLKGYTMQIGIAWFLLGIIVAAVSSRVH